MKQLVSWTNAALRERKHHPLLIIAVFIVRFLGIHPFQDGNGRLSRALTTLMLLRADYRYVPYSSLERKIAQERLMAPLAPLSEKILAIVSEHGRVTVREAQALTKANRNTIKDHIAKLVDAGRLARRGRGRSTWYEKA